MGQPKVGLFGVKLTSNGDLAEVDPAEGGRNRACTTWLMPSSVPQGWVPSGPNFKSVAVAAGAA